MKKFNLIFGALFLSGACLAQNSGKINVTKGQKFLVSSTIKTHSVTSAMGQDMQTEMNISSTYNLSVDNAATSQYDLTGTLIKMKMSMSMMGQQMEYDSDKPDASNPMAEGVNQVLNKPQSIKIDQQGKILAAVTSSEDMSPILQQLASTGAGSKEAFLAVSPNLKAGDTFQTDNSDSATGTQTTLKYTVKSISGNMATLSFTGKMKTNKTIETQGMQVNTVSEGTVDGETVVDMKTGVIQTTKSNVKSTGTVNAMGQEMPITADVNTETKVTEVK